MFKNKGITVFRYFDEAEKNNALCGVTSKKNPMRPTTTPGSGGPRHGSSN